MMVHLCSSNVLVVKQIGEIMVSNTWPSSRRKVGTLLAGPVAPSCRWSSRRVATPSCRSTSSPLVRHTWTMALELVITVKRLDLSHKRATRGPPDGTRCHKLRKRLGNSWSESSLTLSVVDGWVDHWPYIHILWSLSSGFFGRLMICQSRCPTMSLPSFFFARQLDPDRSYSWFPKLTETWNGRSASPSTAWIGKEKVAARWPPSRDAQWRFQWQIICFFIGES